MIIKYKDWSNKFYIFGSEDSQDYDVLVEVDNVPKDVSKSSDICKYYNHKLSELLIDKPINANIGVFKDGKIIDLFKGTPDELNNVLYYTYKNHNQFFPNPITSPIKRDVDLKILRVCRFILTFYSRTDMRSDVKKALKGDLKEKLSILRKIDFIKMVEFPGKNETKEDIYKVLGFQFGQVFSLIDGHESESYTKSEICKNYPQLSNLINRGDLDDRDLSILNDCLKRLIDIVESKIDSMPLLESIKTGRYLYHSSNPKDRESIESNGLIPKRGPQWLSDTDIDGDVIFATDSENKEDHFHSTYDDDFWRIDTNKCLNIKWDKDPNFTWGNYKHIYTRSSIPRECLDLVYKGSGESEL